MNSTSIPAGLPWKGTLIPTPAPVKPLSSLTARLGMAYTWKAMDVIEGWVDPDNYHCHELRFSMSIYPSKSLSLRECTLTLKLLPQSGTQATFLWAGAHEARRGRPGPITLTFEPEVSLPVGSLKVGSAAITFPEGEAHPLARVNCDEETEATWRYSQNKSHPIEGGHELLAVVAVPEGIHSIECAAFLVVAVKGNTKSRWKLPADHPDGVRFNIDLV